MHLYLESYGTKLSAREGLFEVMYVDENKRIQKVQHPPGEVRSIWLHSGSLVTVAALELALRHDVDIVFTDFRGQPIGRFQPHQPTSTSLTQKAQAIVSQRAEALEWVKEWVARKLQNQQDFLRELSARRTAPKAALAEKAADDILVFQQNIQQLKADHVKDVAGTLRGLEGNAGRVYFGALSNLLAKRYRFEGRSFQPARDAFNTFLNYGYAILYPKVEAALTRAGLNPWLGFLHRDGYRYRGMVYDFIEPWRVQVERVVMHLFSEKGVSEKHTEPTDNGGVQLNAEGKRLLVPAIQKQFAEKKTAYREGRYTPEYLLKRDAEQFAARLRDAVGPEALTDEAEAPLAAFALN